MIQEEVLGNVKKLDPTKAPLRTLFQVKNTATIRDIRTYRLYTTARDDSAGSEPDAAQKVFAPAQTVSVVSCRTHMMIG